MSHRPRSSPLSLLFLLLSGVFDVVDAIYAYILLSKHAASNDVLPHYYQYRDMHDTT